MLSKKRDIDDDEKIQYLPFSAPRLKPNERRLDSLARLLESDMVCAAVCQLDDTIYITTNDLFARATQYPSGKKIDFLMAWMSHLFSKDFLSGEDNVKIPADSIDLILQNYNGKLSGLVKTALKMKPSITEDCVRKIIAELLSVNETHEWMDKSDLAYFEQFLLDTHEMDIQEEDLVQKKQIAQKARQREMLNDIQKVFELIWRDVRDYRKYRQWAIEHVEDIRNYSILSIGKEGEHAEIRMIGFLLNQANLFIVEDENLKLSSPLYVGISKLCCPFCIRFIEEFSRLTKGKKDNELQTLHRHSSEAGEEEAAPLSQNPHAMQEAEAMMDEWLANVGATLKVRGKHSIAPNQWIIPAYAHYVHPPQEYNISYEKHSAKDTKEFKKVVNRETSAQSKQIEIVQFTQLKENRCCCIVSSDIAVYSGAERKNKDASFIARSIDCTPHTTLVTLIEQLNSEEQGPEQNEREFISALLEYSKLYFKEGECAGQYRVNQSNIDEKWQSFDDYQIGLKFMRLLDKKIFSQSVAEFFINIKSKKREKQAFEQQVASLSDSGLEILPQAKQFVSILEAIEEPEIKDLDTDEKSGESRPEKHTYASSYI